MDIKKTPFIRPIALNGGSFYIFPSALNHLILFLGGNEDYIFRFSTFALLNLPDISHSTEFTKNYMRFVIPSAYRYIRDNRRNVSDINLIFAEIFQNYCLNLETLILNDENYNIYNFQTPSERVFFKWLKEMGVLRFQPSFEDGFFEEENSSDYKKVVKYIGNIDIVNNYFGTDNSYYELYIHVPENAGEFPFILFNSIFDENYRENTIYTKSSYKEYLAGRNYSDLHPIEGFDTRGYYDWLNKYFINEKRLILKKYKKELKNLDKINNLSDFEDGWWYDINNDYSYVYFTEGSDYKNDLLAIGDSSSNLENLNTWSIFLRSRLDGIMLNFNANDYYRAAIKKYNQGILFLDDLSTLYPKDFEFNCILIYYDICSKPQTVQNSEYDSEYETDSADEFQTPYEDILARNLFGVVFLDNVSSYSNIYENEGLYLPIGIGKIPRFQKCVPNKQLKTNGNSYTFKLNTKFNAAGDVGVSVEKFFASDREISLSIFLDAMNEIKKLSDTVFNLSSSYINISNEINNIKSTLSIYNSNYLNYLLDKVNTLDEKVNNSILYSSKNDLILLLNDINRKMDNYIKGKIDPKLILDNLLYSGDNMKLESDSTFNRIKLSSLDKYNIDEKSIIYVTDKCINENYCFKIDKDLLPNDNYIKLIFEKDYLYSDIFINIKDDKVKWIKGQRFKIILNNLMLKEGRKVYINTLYENSNNEERYLNLIFTIDNLWLKKYNKIEIICIEDDYSNKEIEFTIDSY